MKLEEYYLTVEYFSNLGYKVQIICEILGLNRSSYYKRKNREITKKEYKDQYGVVSSIQGEEIL